MFTVGGIADFTDADRRSAGRGSADWGGADFGWLPLIYVIVIVGVGVKITGIPMITRYHGTKGNVEKKLYQPAACGMDAGVTSYRLALYQRLSSFSIFYTSKNAK